MTKYSKIYKNTTFHFRYNYDDAILEYVWKDTDTDTWEVIDGTGLSVEHWEADKKGYIQVYTEELKEETDYLVADFVKNELPYYQK